MRADRIARALGEQQHGVVAAWQLRAFGASKQDVDTLRRRSTGWVPLSRRVLGRSGVPLTDDARLMAAVLDASPGAAISLTTAAAVWQAPGFTIDPVHVVRHRGVSRRPSDLAVVHEVVDLHPDHIKLVRGIPVISPARVVCELAGSLRPQRAEHVLDRFWSRGLVDGATFRRTVAQFAGRGRTGSTLLRELDAVRGPSYRPPDSGLERRFEALLRRAGVPALVRQVDTGGDEWCGRVDFRDPTTPLVVEVQSAAFHSSLVDWRADAARRTRLEAAGFVVVEVWDADIWHNTDVVLTAVQDGRRRAQHRTRTRDGGAAA